jgi:hypothetical protein
LARRGGLAWTRVGATARERGWTTVAEGCFTTDALQAMRRVVERGRDGDFCPAPYLVYRHPSGVAFRHGGRRTTCPRNGRRFRSGCPRPSSQSNRTAHTQRRRYYWHHPWTEGQSGLSALQSLFPPSVAGGSRHIPASLPEGYTAQLGPLFWRPTYAPSGR